jgi:hypothetical protein
MAHIHPEASEVMPMPRKPPPDKWNLLADAPAVMLAARAHGQSTHRLRIGAASSDTGAACRSHIDPAKVLA